MSKMCVSDVDMRSSAKQPIWEVEADSAPSWMPAMIAMINANLDTKLTGLERRMDQVVGIHQVRLDKHDAELDSQRQLLEELRSEIRLLRHSGFSNTKPASDSSSETASTVGSFTQAEWCPKSVLVRGWAPFGSAASSKIDRIEYKKVANELLCCLPSGLQNNVIGPCTVCR